MWEKLNDTVVNSGYTVMRRTAHFMTKPYTRFHTSPFVSSWSPAEIVTQAIPHLLKKKNKNKPTLLCSCAVSFEENMQTGLLSALHFSLIAEYQRACNQIWMENLSLLSSLTFYIWKESFSIVYASCALLYDNTSCSASSYTAAHTSFLRLRQLFILLKLSRSPGRILKSFAKAHVLVSFCPVCSPRLMHVSVHQHSPWSVSPSQLPNSIALKSSNMTLSMKPESLG